MAAALLANRPMPPGPIVVEPMEVLIVDRPRPTEAEPPVPKRPDPPRPEVPRQAPAVRPHQTPTPQAPAPPGVALPPGPYASDPKSAEDGVRAALRKGLGCTSQDFLKLSAAERERCLGRFGKPDGQGPTYAALSPRVKAEFDGDCKPDDEWCLYRVGKGPYPGLFALGKKKKKDW